MEWANQIRETEPSCSLGENKEASESSLEMQITENGFDESSTSVDPKEAKQEVDIFGDGDRLSNDSSGNLTVLN